MFHAIFFIKLVDGPSLKKSKQVEGPSLFMFNFKTKSFKSLVQLSKVHEGPVEASGYKVCTLGIVRVAILLLITHIND